MSPLIARRLGACASTFTKYRHASLFTTSSKWQQQTSHEADQEHQANLSHLQSEDRRFIIPVKDSVNESIKQAEEARELVASIPKTLETLLSAAGSVHSLASYRSTIKDVLASIDKFEGKNKVLLEHLEDLEREPYPPPGATDNEIEWETRVRNMSPQEQKHELTNLELEATKEQNHLNDSLRDMGVVQDESPVRESPRKTMPFNTPSKGGNARKAEKKAAAVGKAMYGLNQEEQFAGVVADASKDAEAGNRKRLARVEDRGDYGLGQHSGEVMTWKPTVPVDDRVNNAANKAATPAPREKVNSTEKPKTGGFLSSLQAKLEASYKK